MRVGAERLVAAHPPEKLHLTNTDSAYDCFLSLTVSTLRGKFFASQLTQTHGLRNPPNEGDLLVDGTRLCGIGRPKRISRQIDGARMRI